MNRILLNTLFAICFIVFGCGIFFGERYPIIIPISFAVIIFLGGVDSLLTRMKIRSRVFLKIGRNKNAIRQIYHSIILGVLWIFIGTMRGHSNLAWKGIDFSVFLGILLFFNAIYQYQTFCILIKDDSILFTGFISIGGEYWTFAKIDKIVIKQNQVIFSKKGDKRKFIFDDEDIQTLKAGLPEQLQAKLEIFE